LSNISHGNFKAIADKYTTPHVRNEIIEAVFDFTNSTKGAPINIVEKDTRRKTYKKLAKVVPMRREQKNALIVPILNINEDLESLKEEEVGIVVKSISKKGRKSIRVKKTYKKEEASLVYIFDSIEFEKKNYLFNYPIFFNFFTNEKKKIYTIENQSLDIYAYGNSNEEVHENLYYQFATTYQRLIQINDNQLSEHLKNVKSQYNLIINSIKNI
jgi:hypothetical protein